MGRLRRLVAFVRVVLVAVGLCLLGVDRPTPAPLAPPGLDADAGCTGVDLPDPGPLLAEERDAPASASSADDAAAAPPAHDVPATLAPRRVVLPRGPPTILPATSGRPRSSRGPPDPV